MIGDERILETEVLGKEAGTRESRNGGEAGVGRENR